MVDTLLSGQLLAAALVTGALYALTALGLNLVYGTMRLLNVAHGDLVMIGAYVAFWAFSLLSLSPLLGLFAAAGLAALFGLALYHGLFRRMLEGGKAAQRLEANSLLLFFTGKTRAAGDILAEQKMRTEAADAAMLANLDEVKKIGQEIGAALEAGDFAAYGELMHRHWVRKQERSKSVANPRIAEIYEYARANGAAGGKLVGAGGGGFLLFYAPEPNRLRRAMEGKGLRELRFGFDQSGTRIIET